MLEFEVIVDHPPTSNIGSHQAIYIVSVFETEENKNVTLNFYSKIGKTKDITVICIKDQIRYGWSMVFEKWYSRTPIFGYYYDNYPKSADIITMFSDMGGKIIGFKMLPQTK